MNPNTCAANSTLTIFFLFFSISGIHVHFYIFENAENQSFLSINTFMNTKTGAARNFFFMH